MVHAYKSGHRKIGSRGAEVQCHHQLGQPDLPRQFLRREAGAGVFGGGGKFLNHW